MEQIKITDMKLEAGWLMVKPDREDMGKAMAAVRTRKGKTYSVEIKEYRQKRSLDANAYAWVLMGKLAKEMHLSPAEVYQEQIRNLGNNYTPGCFREKDVPQIIKSWKHNGLGWVVDDLGPSQVRGCRNLAMYHGSSTYDTATMARLIDKIVEDCKALGIETLPPEKLALLKEEWDDA